MYSDKRNWIFTAMTEIELYTDTYFMKQALREAEKAFDEGEVPVGAVIVTDRQIITRAYNQTEKLSDTTAHAEILAITGAAAFLGSKYLPECTLYVTLEPCVMCAGALFWTQIGRIVYGAEDPKRGFMKYGKEMLHPKTQLEFGVLSGECGTLVSRFFKQRREMDVRRTN